MRVARAPGTAARPTRSIISRDLARAARLALPMPWMRSPSPMLSPIGERGSSDAYGSWKMICIRRRNGFSSSPLSLAMSVPSNMIVPAVGSIRRSSSRPTVVLPQPDSPTRPSVSPRRIVEVHAVHGLDLGDGAPQDAALDREVLDQAADLDQRPVSGRPARPRSRSPSRRWQRAGAHAALRSSAQRWTSSRASSLIDEWYSQQRTVVVGGRRAAARDGPPSAGVTSCSIARRAARREAAARRQVDQVGHHARDDRQLIRGWPSTGTEPIRPCV